MIVVFQGETGGFIQQTIPEEIVTAVSGYVDVISTYRSLHRVYGTLNSGILFIAKSGLCNLTPGQYTLLYQVVDSSNLLYFLDPEELRLIEIPII